MLIIITKLASRYRNLSRKHPALQTFNSYILKMRDACELINFQPETRFKNWTHWGSLIDKKHFVDIAFFSYLSFNFTTIFFFFLINWSTSFDDFDFLTYSFCFFFFSVICSFHLRRFYGLIKEMKTFCITFSLFFLAVNWEFLRY